MRLAILVAATFVAFAVEMVEALTIVLAVGLTHGWRAVRLATATALLALAVIVVVLGPTLMVVPLATLRIVVGFLLLSHAPDLDPDPFDIPDLADLAATLKDVISGPRVASSSVG